MMSSDITKCYGDGCPIKDNCYRYTTPQNQYRQSYFAAIPGNIKEDKFVCEMFWGDVQNRILHQLNDIVDGKEKK